MKIDARTNSGEMVCIVQFVIRYNHLYAVAITRRGSIIAFDVNELTITDKSCLPFGRF